MQIHDILKYRKGWKHFIVDGVKYDDKTIAHVEMLQVDTQKIDFANQIIYITTK